MLGWSEAFFCLCICCACILSPAVLLCFFFFLRDVATAPDVQHNAAVIIGGEMASPRSVTVLCVFFSRSRPRLINQFPAVARKRNLCVGFRFVSVRVLTLRGVGMRVWCPLACHWDFGLWHRIPWFSPRFGFHHCVLSSLVRQTNCHCVCVREYCSARCNRGWRVTLGVWVRKDEMLREWLGSQSWRMVWWRMPRCPVLHNLCISIESRRRKTQWVGNVVVGVCAVSFQSRQLEKAAEHGAFS